MKKLLLSAVFAFSVPAFACPTCPSGQDYLDLVRSHGLLASRAMTPEGSDLYLRTFEALSALPSGGENTIHSGVMRLYATSDPAGADEVAVFNFTVGYSSDYYYGYAASALPLYEAQRYDIAYAEKAMPLAVASPAPEPATYALMLLGIAALIGRRLTAS